MEGDCSTPRTSPRDIERWHYNSWPRNRLLRVFVCVLAGTSTLLTIYQNNTSACAQDTRLSPPIWLCDGKGLSHHWKVQSSPPQCLTHAARRVILNVASKTQPLRKRKSGGSATEPNRGGDSIQLDWLQQYRSFQFRISREFFLLMVASGT